MCHFPHVPHISHTSLQRPSFYLQCSSPFILLVNSYHAFKTLLRRPLLCEAISPQSRSLTLFSAPIRCLGQTLMRQESQNRDLFVYCLMPPLAGGQTLGPNTDLTRSRASSLESERAMRQPPGLLPTAERSRLRTTGYGQAGAGGKRRLRLLGAPWDPKLRPSPPWGLQAQRSSRKGREGLCPRPAAPFAPGLDARSVFTSELGMSHSQSVGGKPGVLSLGDR